MTNHEHTQNCPSNCKFERLFYAATEDAALTKALTKANIDAHYFPILTALFRGNSLKTVEVANEFSVVIGDKFTPIQKYINAWAKTGEGLMCAKQKTAGSVISIRSRA